MDSLCQNSKHYYGQPRSTTRCLDMSKIFYIEGQEFVDAWLEKKSPFNILKNYKNNNLKTKAVSENFIKNDSFSKDFWVFFGPFQIYHKLLEGRNNIICLSVSHGVSIVPYKT